ncbi:STAS domain-containing protein [Actinomadura sp. ATCC 31491]|uniref:Anti-sigma factor antagonist n=1 Tax=Actinomadura luzonensis TaxID=2805427 RepID=A0ABT0FPC2_9ACTN|nr:STAS domain-containing protein [Actinomadura luzonensis]MCK2213766.1 STAS domain-containing protein [Actinomadura luzonensis]
MSPLSLDVRALPSGVLITVAGEVDSTNADWLETSINQAGRSGAALVLDLGGLTFLDSSGLHVLLRLNAAARERGGGLHLADVRDVPARVLQITGVWSALDIHPTAAEAVVAALDGHVSPLQEPQ